MADKIYYTRHDAGLTLYRNGKQSTVSNTHQNFALILDALKSKAYDKLEKLMDIGRTITAAGMSRRFKDRKVFVEAGRVYYIDSHKAKRELHGTLVDRILDDLTKPHALKYGDALLLFMDNVMKNSVKDIRQELYEWLMSGKTPITTDGHFLAYKIVKGDYKDIYTGKMDNSPGKTVSMPQESVDKDRNHECSVGLHFCSRNYLSSYGGGPGGSNKVVIVKINPRHVFAIPRDYNHQKGRCSQYTVIGEYKGDWSKNDAFKDSFIDEDNKTVAAPEVEFITGGLRPSLETIAESYGIVVDGKVDIIVRRGKYIPVLPVSANKPDQYVDILGNPVDGEPKEMSFQTKSVREAVKAAVASAESPTKS